jgi:hypothetical protein
MIADERHHHLARRSSSACAKYCGRLPEDLIRPPQLPDLPLQLLEAIAFSAGQAAANSLVTFGLAQPLPKGLRGAPDLPRDRADRRPLGLMLRLVLHDHADRPLPHLRCVSACSSHDPILSRNGASGKPGAVQCGHYYNRRQVCGMRLRGIDAMSERRGVMRLTVLGG